MHSSLKWFVRSLCLCLATMLVAALPAAGQWENAQPPRGAKAVPYWISMMRDQADFFRTAAAFDAYFQDREQQRGNGWKPFNRWAYLTELMLEPDGRRPPPDRTFNVVRAYRARRAGQPRTATGSWTSLGPHQQPSLVGTSQPIGVGRVNALAFDPNKSSVVYAGTPAGGLWRTQDNGASWDPLTDDLPRLGVSSIVVDPSDSKILFIGTGDRDAFDTPGIGVMRSSDGGANWSPRNNGMGAVMVNGLIMNPSDRLTLLAATSDGVYKTTDGGDSWARKWGQKTFCTEILFKPGDPSTVYMSVTGTVYRSSDMGDTWKIPNGMPAGSSRVALAVTPAKPEYLYCLTTPGEGFGGVYRSEDSGNTFQLRADRPNLLGWETDGSDSSGQGWYDLALAVAPGDPETVYVGGVNIWKSSDGGGSWKLNTHWQGKVHADHHTLDYAPDGRLFCGNDGGVYVTADGTSWKDISAGMTIGQIYRISQSPKSRDLLIGGFQDNGTSILDGSWLAVLGGDGMDCAIDPNNDRIMYAEHYNGYLKRSTDRGRTFKSMFPTALQYEQAAWVMPYFLDAADSRALYAGLWNVWRTRNAQAGQPSWERLSDFGGQNAYSCIMAMAQSKADPRIVYAARRDRTLFRCDDIRAGTPSWTALGQSLPYNALIKAVEAHPGKPDTVYMTQNRRVYESSNRGAKWDNITGSLPQVVFFCLAYDAVNDTLYVGSEVGVFFRREGDDDWSPYDQGLPNVPVFDMEFYHDAQNASLSRVRAATFGRGLWEAPMIAGGGAVGAREAADTVLSVAAGEPFTLTTSAAPIELFLGSDPDPSEAALRIRYTGGGFASWNDGQWFKVGSTKAALRVFGRNVRLDKATVGDDGIVWSFVHRLNANQDIAVFQAEDGGWAEKLRVRCPAN